MSKFLIDAKISAGEIADRISILTLKWERASASDDEMGEAGEAWKSVRRLCNNESLANLDSAKRALDYTNASLWHIEDLARTRGSTVCEHAILVLDLIQKANLLRCMIKAEIDHIVFPSGSGTSVSAINSKVYHGKDAK